MIEITIHLEADKLADAINILAAAILGTPASKAEGTQFQLQPVRGSEGADPAKVAELVNEQIKARIEKAEKAAAPVPTGPQEAAAITAAEWRASAQAEDEGDKEAAAITAELESDPFPTKKAAPPKKAEPKPAAPNFAAAAESAKKAVTMEQIRKLMAAKAGAGKGEACSALLQKYGSGILTKIDPAKYADLLAEVEGL